MKKFNHPAFFIAILLGLSVQSQVLHINGNQPTPFADLTGMHQIQVNNTPYDSSGVLVFPQESTLHHYLFDDTVNASFYPNNDWVTEFKVYSHTNAEEFYFLDWGSSSLTGHVRFCYIPNKGVHFSDRNVNGLAGFILIDSLPLPIDSWTKYTFSKTGSLYQMFRNDTLVHTNSLTDTLTTPTRLTIGYSEDDRPYHAWFCMDDIMINSTITATKEHKKDKFVQVTLEQGYPTLVNNRRAGWVSLFSSDGKYIHRQFVQTGTHRINIELKSGTYILQSEDHAQQFTVIR